MGEDGRLTDSKGRTVDFKNTLIIMTSNIGSKVIEKGGGGLGFEFSGDDAEETQYNRIKEKGILLSVTEAFKERLVEEGYNPAYGARPLRRAVMRLLEDSLAEEFLAGRLKKAKPPLWMSTTT